ncbi:MAG TPA: type II toxin-antitoxin system VapC family toxin [Candidatus Binataceae bacterium]|nr:type II toxin-antitoxin system VapC family toxin [Candidatus Binataceae bacterium]
MYLIDTNVISEVGKGQRCNPRVAAWYQQVGDEELFLSVLVVGEIRQGIERLRLRSARRADRLEQWLEELLHSFADRILPVDEEVAQNWGRLNARDSLPVVDALLAATAQTHGLVVATRNLKDIERSGVRCINPFAAVPSA